MRHFGNEEQRELETGVIVDGTGCTSTEHHVVGGARCIQLCLMDDRGLEAKVQGADPQTDPAVISIGAQHERNSRAVVTIERLET